MHIMNRLDGQFSAFQAVIWSLEIHENCINWIRLRQEIIQREYLKDFWIFSFGMLISNSRSLILKILELSGNAIFKRIPGTPEESWLWPSDANEVNFKVSNLIIKWEFSGLWMTGLRIVVYDCYEFWRNVWIFLYGTSPNCSYQVFVMWNSNW